MIHVYAVAVGGVLAVAIGLVVHLLDRRHVEDALVGALQRANIALHRANARIDDADDPFRGQWVAPTPQAWATFQEGPERAGEN